MISFARKYPVDFKNSTGLVIPVKLSLSVSGPVDSKSGMLVNLVDLDREARRLIQNFEKQKFDAPESALHWIRNQWILAAQKLGVRVAAVQLRGRFGLLRWSFDPDLENERMPTWTLQSFKVDAATNQSGMLFASGRERFEVRRVLNSLKDLKLVNPQSLRDWAALHASNYKGLVEVGFQLRKSKAQFRISFQSE